MLWLPVILTSPHLMWTHVACLYDNVGIALTSQLPKAAFHLFVCSVCHRAPLCLTHYTLTHTRLIPTQTLFSLRKSIMCLICRAEERAQLWSITLRLPGYPANHGSTSPDYFLTYPHLSRPERLCRILSTQVDIIRLTSHIEQQQTLSSNMKRTALYPHGMRMAPKVAEWNQGNQPDRNESVSVTSPHHGRTVLVETDQTKTLFPRAQKEQEQRSHKNKQNKELKCEKMNSSFSPLPHIGIFPSTHESLLSWELRVKSMNSDTSQLELKAKLYCLFASVSSVPVSSPVK